MAEVSLADRLAVRERPAGRPVMYQAWSDLTFLHWEVDPAEVQMRLPEGLRVDTFEGKTYVGLVPFTMQGVRPSWSPRVPGLSDFHETNVRVYVVGPDGTPGVWFYSLEAANPVGAWLGRSWFGLPYFWARMSLDKSDLGVDYGSRRMRGGGGSSIQVRAMGEAKVAEPGSLEFWLVERYVLFSLSRAGVMRSGRVWHEPYLVGRAVVEWWESELVGLAGFPVEGGPDLVHWSPGVEVDVYRLERV